MEEVRVEHGSLSGFQLVLNASDNQTNATLSFPSLTGPEPETQTPPLAPPDTSEGRLLVAADTVAVRCEGVAG